jgi:GDP-4-dehydro-6-deoxy-D-mannose reductase
LRVLITGASGFAGGWLARACDDAGDEVLGVSRRGLSPAGASAALDLRDGDAVRSTIAEFAPEVVYHLAALSSVGRSWEHPAQTVNDNVASAVSVLESVRLAAPAARLVWVSSCEVYGVAERLPITEDAPLQPANPYGVSKTAGDLLAAVYAGAHGLEIVRARPFNHTGPGQREIFIVSSLAHQAAQGRIAGVSELEIVTGNPDTRRDFTDVRDVARAYRLLGSGPAHEAGTRFSDRGAPAFNVSTGRSVSTAELVELLAEAIAPIRVRHTVDHARVRAHEVMDLRGANDRLTAATVWRPEIPLALTIREMVDWWERELVGAART